MIWIIGDLGPEAVSAIPVLIRHLGDPKPRINIERECIAALGHIGTPAIGPLLAVVRSDPLLAKRRALEALGRIGPPAKGLVPMFIRLLNDSPPAIRITATLALGNIGPGAALAVPVLKGLQGDRDILLRKHVDKALSRIEGTIAS